MEEELALSNLMAKLNDVVDVLGALRAGRLGPALGSSVAKGCDYHCGCNDSYCRCNGSVKSAGMDTVSFPEFLAIREARLAELKREIESLSLPQNLR